MLGSLCLAAVSRQVFKDDDHHHDFSCQVFKAGSPSSTSNSCRLSRRLQPVLLIPAMPSRRPCLSADLKQAINELDYLSMSVAEAMRDIYRMNILQEVATLVKAEQSKLLDIGGCVFCSVQLAM